MHQPIILPPHCCRPFCVIRLVTELLNFDMFVLEGIDWAKENVPELSWLTSSQLDVGGVAIPLKSYNKVRLNPVKLDFLMF